MYFWNCTATDVVPAYNERRTASLIIAILVFCIMFPLIVSSNVLVIACVVKFKRLQIPANYFLCNLAVSDILVGVSMPLVYFTEHQIIVFPGRSLLCLAFYCSCIIACSMSLLNLTITAYDRFSALVTPLKYSTLVTVNTSVIVIISSWITMTALGLSPLMGWYTLCPICSFHMIKQNCILFLLGGIFLPNFLSICYFYYRIMSIARKQSRAISAIHLAIYPVLINKNLSLQFKGSKYAKTLAIIMGIFMFSWLPLIVTLVFDIFFSDIRWHEYLIYDYFALFIYCNSALNPWIYSFKNNDFKAALRRLKRKLCSSSYKESAGVARSTSRASIALSRTNSLVGMVNLQLLYNTYKEEAVAEASVELEKTNENSGQGSSVVPRNKQIPTSHQDGVCLSVSRDVMDLNCSDCGVQTEYEHVSEDEVSEIPL